MKNPLSFSQPKLLALPRTKSGREDIKRRGIVNLGEASVSRALSACGIGGSGHTALIGKYGRTMTILRRLTEMSDRQYVIVSGRGDLKNSCLKSFEHDWELECCQADLPDGNGIVTVSGAAGELLMLIENCLPIWAEIRLIIICLGAIRMDPGMADVLAPADCIFMTDSLYRSTKAADAGRYSPQEFVAQMDGIICSGASAKEISGVLPKYDCEKLTDTTDLSLHDGSAEYSDRQVRRNGLGFRLSQSRTVEEKPILSQGELSGLMDNGFSLFYNAGSGRLCTAKIVR